MATIKSKRIIATQQLLKVCSQILTALMSADMIAYFENDYVQLCRRNTLPTFKSAKSETYFKKAENMKRVFLWIQENLK